MMDTSTVNEYTYAIPAGPKYPFRTENEKSIVIGNKRRVVVIFKEPAYILPNGQWYTKTDASGFAITGSRVSREQPWTGIGLQKRLMRHSVEVEAVCFSIGYGIFMKVGNAHKPDYVDQRTNWWDQDPFSLRFWNESSRKSLGEAIEIQFNLGDRKVWVKNPLEVEQFIARRPKDTETQQVLVEWGVWAGLCKDTPRWVSYQDQVTPAATNFVSNITLPSTATYTQNDLRVFQVLKGIFYPGVMKVYQEINNLEWGTKGFGLIADISDRTKRALYKCSSVSQIVETYTGRTPKTLVKAFNENLHAIIGKPSAGYHNTSDASSIVVFIDCWVKLTDDLIKAEVPMEYIVQMVPHMKIAIFDLTSEFRTFFIDVVKEFGYVKVLGWLERKAESVPIAGPVPDDPVVRLQQALQAIHTSNYTSIDHLVEACRILKGNRSKLERATSRQLKVFPHGIQPRRYYKTAEEMHNDFSAQSSRFEELGNSTVIKWDKRWFHVHGSRSGELRILLPRTTGSLIRWGKQQKHCIASYANSMLPKHKNELIYGDDPTTDRSILAGVFNGSKILYCIRMEHHDGKEAHYLGNVTDPSRSKSIPWTLKEFRGMNNAAPEILHAKQVCDMLDQAGVYTTEWRRSNIKEEQGR